MSELMPLEGAALAAAVAERLCTVIQATPALVKDEVNKFAKYAYVGIDQYYETFAKVAAEHGLTWVTRQTGFEVIMVQVAGEGRGPPQERVMAQITYAFDVCLANAGILTDYSAITILHAITGPQTAGSAASYAEKVFCRVALKAVTGEADGDAEQPHAVQSAPERGGFPGAAPAARPNPPRQTAAVPAKAAPKAVEPEPEPEPVGFDAESQEEEEYDPADAGELSEVDAAIDAAKGMIANVVKGRYPVLKDSATDWAIVREIFRAFSPTLQRGELQAFWTDNGPVLEAMKEDDEKTYADIVGFVKSRLGALKEAGQ
jgi:hypothetical protein